MAKNVRTHGNARPKVSNFKRRYGCRWLDQFNRAMKAMGLHPRREARASK